MNKYILMLSLLCYATIDMLAYTAPDTALCVITVQFPTCIQNVPSIVCYCGGTKLKGDCDPKTNRICFTAEMPRYRTLFDVVITPALAYKIAPTQAKQINNSTLLCLKIPEKQPYKCYTIELITILPEHQSNNITDVFAHAPHYQWRIIEQTLPDRQIPDQAVIICMNPDFVSHLSGGSAVELPKIIIRDDILSLVASEKALHDQSARQTLDLMLIDLLHAQQANGIETRHADKTIVAMNTP